MPLSGVYQIGLCFALVSSMLAFVHFKIDFKRGVKKDETEELFKSVYFRAQETKRSDGIIKDELAVKLVKQFAPNFSKLMTERYSFVSLFQWGINNCKKMESWHPGITLIKEYFCYDYYKKPQGWMNLLPFGSWQFMPSDFWRSILPYTPNV